MWDLIKKVEGNMPSGRFVIACVAAPVVATAVIFAAIKPAKLKVEEFDQFEQADAGGVTIVKFHDRRHPQVVTYSCALRELAAKNLIEINNKHGTDLVAENIMLLPGDPEYMEASMTPSDERICP